MPYIPPNYATLFVATCNLLNLANPNRVYYENQDAYNEREYERKIDWIGERFHALNADVLAVQEVWDESALKKDVAYSHIHQGYPEVLDQILVSEEFIAGSRHSLGDVRRVDYFNDHLHEGRDRSRSDHGFVRALLRLRTA